MIRARSCARGPWGAALAGLALAIAGCGAESEPAPTAGESASPARSPAQADAPRSAILVTIDTLRADALGAYGSELGTSPNLDRLAREGVLFEQAHAAASTTLPSHSSLLTGKRPFRHGVRTNFAQALGAEQLTLAERLAEAGFATAAEVASIVLARHTGIDQGFASFRDTESPDVVVSDNSPDMARDFAISHRIRNAEDITARGLEFVERRAGEPFFLWLHYYDPHWPYTPPEPFATRFKERNYAGEVAYVDAQLARLRAALEERGLAERTLLVVTADHGEALGEHAEDTHGYFVFQSTMQVPLLFWGPPDLPAGRRVSRPVRSIDVAPTVLDWLGQPELPDADGRSLLPLFEDPDAGPERVVYGETIELQRVFGAPVLRFVREGRWKYVHKPRPSLYDLAADAGEREDLAARHPERLRELRGRLEALITEAGPVASASAAIDLDPETAAQLEALGYAVGDPAVELGDEVESLNAVGIDADDMFDDVHAITRAWPEDGNRGAEVERMKQLAARYPDSSPVIERLLDAQLGFGLAEEAVVTLRRGIEIMPDKQRYWSNLGELLVKLGRKQEALEVLPEAIERFPCEHTSRITLAQYRAQASDHAARIALLDAGAEADCDDPSPELANELAYALATAPEASLRDADRAVELARSAVEGLPENPLVLDTLAVAQAEQGDRAAAGATLERALALARDQKLPEAVHTLLRDHAQAIAAGEAIRE